MALATGDDVVLNCPTTLTGEFCTMRAPVDFYFDFTSPYAYLSSVRIDAIAARHGRTVTWRPILLGAVFKVTGTPLLVEIPLLGDYARRDMARSARRQGIPFALPERFPVATLAAARAYYRFDAEDAPAAHEFARRTMAAYFAEGRDITDLDTLAKIATGCGLEGSVVQEAADDPEAKARLREETDGAIARGVCGAPFLFVDGEPFWGNDRLDDVDRWLATGGW